MKTIDELKEIVVDGMIVKSGNKEYTIRRGLSNDLRFMGRLISWKNFHSLLLNSDYKLIVHESQQEFSFKSIGPGGCRTGAGRKPIDPDQKKIRKTVTLSPESISRIENFLNSFSETDSKRPSFSEVVETLILSSSI